MNVFTKANLEQTLLYSLLYFLDDWYITLKEKQTYIFANSWLGWCNGNMRICGALVAGSTPAPGPKKRGEFI